MIPGPKIKKLFFVGVADSISMVNQDAALKFTRGLSAREACGLRAGLHAALS